MPYNSHKTLKQNTHNVWDNPGCLTPQPSIEVSGIIPVDGLDKDSYDFATRYLVGLAPLPAFRHLSPDDYQDRVAELIGKIEEEGERKRDGNSVAGTDKILSQMP